MSRVVRMYVTQDERNEIVTRLASGETISELADEYRVPESLITAVQDTQGKEPSGWGE